MRVIAKIGNTTHPRYGLLVEGQEYDIEEAEFGDEIFTKVDEVGVKSAIRNPQSKGRE